MKISHRIMWGADHLIFEGGGGLQTVWVISEKNILHIDFEGKKFLQGNTWQNNPTLKKNTFHGI